MIKWIKQYSCNHLWKDVRNVKLRIRLVNTLAGLREQEYIAVYQECIKCGKTDYEEVYTIKDKPL